MTVTRLSDTFSYNIIFWKLFAIWPTETSSKFYKFYSAVFLFISLFIYHTFNTFSLFFVPIDVELIIREFIFYFTEIAVIAKVSMILFKKKQILEAFDLLDSDQFKGTEDISNNIIDKYAQGYKTWWKFYMTLCHCCYLAVSIMPVALYHFVSVSDLSLPVSNYFFVSDELLDKYFRYWYLFQSFGLYVAMIYNVNMDTFMSGLILMAVMQIKVLVHKVRSIKLDLSEIKNTKEDQEKIALAKLENCLKHYDDIFKYCKLVQSIIGVTELFQYGMASAIICSCMYAFTMPFSFDRYLFLAGYCSAIICEILLPAWFGSELNYQNSQLVVAAFSCDWIPRSEKFKRNLRLFILRATAPLILKGTQLFPLTLQTFLSIMRTAYSLFTLVRNVHDS